MADYLAQLQLYWLKLKADEAELEDYVAGRKAMSNFVIAGVYNPAERARFAQNNVFVDALTLPDNSDGIVNAIPFDDGIDKRPVRAIMLDTIRDAAVGGSMYLLMQKVPGGAAAWIDSAESSAAPFYKALTTDPSDVVLVSAIRFMAEVGLPLKWVEHIVTHDPRGEAIVSRIVRSSLSAKERESALAAARGAVGSMVAATAGDMMQQLEASGTGGGIVSLPPMTKAPWYKGVNLPMIAAISGVLLGGVFYRVRRK